ncbi:uncharacterized protein KQ657_000410 [Scheffersomyces spartinae]|uniref:DUF125-domain-containing protein n=1 Tax=Scheffersomyces spartinae TaxID=45513 RepID=A0A9P7V970_9ASCO|nr:uncharacterized protein KQ657_000410 [Scheffersomyces spartinae]KAG7193720.1 hypothetical protein KQ657_000410 [Scheffersomyces spartinae]
MSVVLAYKSVAKLFKSDDTDNNSDNASTRLLTGEGSGVNTDGSLPLPYGSTATEIEVNNSSNLLESQLNGSNKLNGGSYEDLKLASDSDSNFGGFFQRFDPRVMSDIIIGLSDGLTVPFALTAGLSSLGSSKLVITGGMAELVSGAISMGLGGYLAAKSELDYYKSEVKKEKMEFFLKPETINEEAADILFDIGASEQTIQYFLRDLDSHPKKLIDFIIRFGKGLEEPAEGREITSALTIGLSYFIGGFIPLLPYFFTDVVKTGLLISVIVMLITLFIFGYVKTAISLGDHCGLNKKVGEGIQMVLIGSVAAGAAWSLVYLIE